MPGKKFILALIALFLTLPFLILFIIKNPVSNVLSATTKSYTIILVGDSLTQLLGTAAPELETALKKYYPKTTFNIYNYGQGSTNVLTLKDRLEGNTIALTGDTYPPILQRDFDLIIIESYGNNPLSQYPLDQGLQLQNQALDQAIAEIKSAKPRAKIVFMATIAPNRDRYGEGVVVLMPEQRQQWADERVAYFKNHMAYAKSHNIPLIDVFDKSLKDGTGNIDYLNGNDFIHLSPTGVQLISQTIADFIYDKKLIK